MDVGGEEQERQQRYSLRRGGERKRRGPKPKPQTASMSKYRRREANARYMYCQNQSVTKHDLSPLWFPAKLVSFRFYETKLN
jgi:hypothetical protein